MIPSAYITEWRQFAPWVDDAQVEQDLILCRALVSIYRNPFLRDSLALRGGTALHKLYFAPCTRYSEDIDLVQTTPSAIGAQIDAIRQELGGFLGAKCKRSQRRNSVRLIYRMLSEGPPEVPLRLKIEIHTREHFSVQGLAACPFSVNSRWFSGNCTLTSFTLEELLATKVRALYQRRKGRDLWLGLRHEAVRPQRVMEVFQHYLRAEGRRVTQRELEENLADKRSHPDFAADLSPLLANSVEYDFEEAFDFVAEVLLAHFPKQ